MNAIEHILLPNNLKRTSSREEINDASVEQIKQVIATGGEIGDWQITVEPQSSIVTLSWNGKALARMMICADESHSNENWLSIQASITKQKMWQRKAVPLSPPSVPWAATYMLPNSDTPPHIMMQGGELGRLVAWALIERY
jgi:hypothetical protein